MIKYFFLIILFDNPLKYNQNNIMTILRLVTRVINLYSHDILVVLNIFSNRIKMIKLFRVTGDWSQSILSPVESEQSELASVSAKHNFGDRGHVSIHTG